MGAADAQGQGPRFLAEGLLTREDLAKALKDSGLDGTDLGQAIDSVRTVSRADLEAFLATKSQTPRLTDLREVPFASNASQLVAERTARQHTLVPLCRAGDVLFVVLGGSMDAAAVDALRREAGARIKLVGAPGPQVRAAIEKVYRGSSVDIPDPGGTLDMEELATEVPSSDAIPFISGAEDDGEPETAPEPAAPPAEPVAAVKVGREAFDSALKDPHARLVYEFDQTFLGSDDPAPAQLQP